MSKVIVRRGTYDREVLRPMITDIMGSLLPWVDKGACVLVKPNMFSPGTPEQAIMTHPEVVRGVVEYLQDKGARVIISDSPAVGPFSSVMEVGGFNEALKGLRVECRPFRSEIWVDIGHPFGNIPLAEDAIKADVVVNLAKLKTHTQMTMTLAVKNLFGCVVGEKKAEWHARVGMDMGMFARLIVQIARTIKPTVNIVDGIVALEGDGPGTAGKPRFIGALIGGDDPFSTDLATCTLLGIDPFITPIMKEAGEVGYPDMDGGVMLCGPGDFKLPPITPLIWGPKYVRGIIRGQILRRPVCDHENCHQCGTCQTKCPVGAIKGGNGKVKFDYDTCIRCYRCVEVCPYGVISTNEPLGGILLRRLIRGGGKRR